MNISPLRFQIISLHRPWGALFSKCLALILGISAVGAFQIVDAADIQKASTGTDLTAAASWVGAPAAAPTLNDYGLFDSLANTGSTFTVPSGNPTWGGIKVTNPASNVNISVTTGTWTLAGNSGASTFIDLSSANTGDLTIDGSAAGKLLRMATAATSYAINVAGGRTFTLGSNMSLISQNNTRTLTLQGGGSMVFNGAITAGNLSISVNNAGGIVTFSNANTYSGASTTVSAGKLLLTNTTGSGTSTGTVAVSGGISGTLSGNGTSSGALTVTNASRLAPGINTSGANGNFGVAGTLSLGTTGGMTLTSANFDFDLANTATTAGGGVNDLIATGGPLSLSATEAFTFNQLNGS